MEQVNDGVYLATSGSKAYLIDGDEGVTLIDTGLPRKDGQVRAKLKEIGRTITDVKAIVITHGHTDHYGTAAILKEESGAQLVASAIDAPILRGESKPPLPPFASRNFVLKPLLSLLPAPKSVEVDHTHAGDEPVPLVSDVSVVQTPGHTDGHMCVMLDRAGGILFVGDAAAANKSGKVGRGFFNISNEAIDGSIRKIALLNFSTAYFGHSNPITKDASGAFTRFAESI